MLNDSAAVDKEVSRQDFAERLSLWLGAFDAVTLDAAHQSLKAVDAGWPSSLASPASVQEEYHRVRTSLLKAFGQIDGLGAPETDGKYAPYRKHYLEQQRQMEAKIGTLRAHVRHILARAATPLGQLAALDAVWEQMLGGREQKLLAVVPALLERRFKHLHKAHQQTLDVTAQPDDPAAGRQRGGWLDRFGQELREILVAEMDVRLQPVVGLMEAFSSEVRTYQ